MFSPYGWLVPLAFATLVAPAPTATDAVVNDERLVKTPEAFARAPETSLVLEEAQTESLPRAVEPSSVNLGGAQAEFLVANALLDAARTARTSGDAYAHFERVARRIAQSQLRAPAEAVTTYLEDETAPLRETLLGCLADHELEISDGRLLRVCAELLRSAKPRLARAAAMALSSGGPRARRCLHAALEQLPTESRQDIVGLLSFSDDYRA